jgi:hypothetical protein
MSSVPFKSIGKLVLHFLINLGLYVAFLMEFLLHVHIYIHNVIHQLS